MAPPAGPVGRRQRGLLPPLDWLLGHLGRRMDQSVVVRKRAKMGPTVRVEMVRPNLQTGRRARWWMAQDSHPRGHLRPLCLATIVEALAGHPTGLNQPKHN